MVTSIPIVHEAEWSRPEDLLHQFYTRKDRRHWAAVSEVVFTLARDGDSEATAIASAAATALAQLAETVAQRLDSTGPIVLSGGILVHQRQAALDVKSRLSAVGITDVRVLNRPPVAGAVALAAANSAPREETP